MTASLTRKPVVKGWCPGAHRPMESGDGFVYRIRPFFGELTAAQVLGLCELAERFGNGMLDLTSRANLQIRGVSDASNASLLSELAALGLLDNDPSVEPRRNILMPPDWQTGDLTYRLYNTVFDALPNLPALPDKMGIAIDTGASASLRVGSADFRFELDVAGQLLLRADGAQKGRPISERDAAPALSEMAKWFRESGGPAKGRMSRHLEQNSVPEAWALVAPRATGTRPSPGQTQMGAILGAPFGKVAASQMRALVEESGATHLRPMLNRMFILVNARVTDAHGFVEQPSRKMEVQACPGAPYCPQATVETIPIAEALAAKSEGSLHVSGCAKGCAYPRNSALTLVGRDGRFDLVSNGRPWDVPIHRGLSPTDLDALIELS